MNEIHGPELPLAHAATIGAKPRVRANPGQIKAYDNRDDRLEIARLLGRLAPNKRLAFFRWACAKAVMPGTANLHPGVAPSTVELARQARRCDQADERLTIDILTSLTHLWLEYSLDAKACLEQLVGMARRPTS